MRILFLHIGDLHIKNKKGFNAFQIKKIADSLNTFGGFDRLIIVVTGDIAHSGEEHQYKTAEKCLGSLVTSIRQQYTHSEEVNVLCVPGNHDVCMNDKSLSNQDLQSMRQNNSYDKSVESELEKQMYFLNFAKRNGCFVKSDKIYCQRIINLNGVKIEANLINSGLFSTLGEDKGLHYIPQYCINEFNMPTGADFVLTAMHHSPDWYIDSQKHELETAIYQKSSLVFYGHEHYISHKTICQNNCETLIQAGGCLCINEDWINSTYYLGVLETDTLKYKQSKFVWNKLQQQYEQKETNEHSLQKKPSLEKGISVNSDYLASLCTDRKHSVLKDFREYFVFPRLQTKDPNGKVYKEYISEEEFFLELLSKKKCLITGGYNSGKTTLLKSLFLQLSRDYVVILCKIDDIRGRRSERIIKNCFQDIYGENDSDYIRFLQLSKDKRILLVDDIHQIEPESLKSFINQLEDMFGYFIFTSNQVLDLSLLERMKSCLDSSDLVYKYEIAPFYSDKRYKLIEKVVATRNNDSNYISKVTNILSESIKTQKRFISLDPDFIIKYVEYYCNNIGEAFNTDNGVFSKVFEASLINVLSTYQTPKLSVDKMFKLLSKIAHFIHFHKAYPISEDYILEIIHNYNEEYGADVKSISALNIMVKSQIIYENNAGGYYFSNRNYLAFFVAREVNSQYNENGDDSDLQKLLKLSCFGMNADILLFISYITDNPRILRLILHNVNEYTKDWDEFEFGDGMPQFLKNDRKHIISSPNYDSREKHEKAEIEAEKSSYNEIKTIDVYDYSEEEVDHLVNQIIRACSLLVIVAKCLPNFEHNMPKQDKDAFIDVIYRLPNKIFHLWALEADKMTDSFIEFFKQEPTNDRYKRKGITEDKIVRAMQQAAMSLLLDLYYLSVFYSTKDNTIQYLSNFDFASRDTYSLEHLMMLEKQSNCDEFASTAMSIADPKKGNIFNTLLTIIVKHALIYMDNVDFRKSQQLQSKFFPKENKNKLLTQRLGVRKNE